MSGTKAAGQNSPLLRSGVCSGLLSNPGLCRRSHTVWSTKGHPRSPLRTRGHLPEMGKEALPLRHLGRCADVLEGELGKISGRSRSTSPAKDLHCQTPSFFCAQGRCHSWEDAPLRWGLGSTPHHICLQVITVVHVSRWTQGPGDLSSMSV